MPISNNDLKKFSRQIILKKIGVVGQKRIFSSKVLVIGAGGLGCPLILYLANSGVGNIGIVDNDKIEISNLNRQVLFTEDDIGKYKVSQAKKIIKRINKKINVKIFKERLNKKNIKRIFNKFDIICDGSDNFETRFLINDYCLKYQKILISSAISKFEGHLFNFNFKKKIPCLRCFMPEYPELQNDCETEGVLSTLAGIAGTLQANEVIKSILKTKSDLEGKIMIFDTLMTNFKKIKLTKNPNCVSLCVKRYS